MTRGIDPMDHLASPPWRGSGEAGTALLLPGASGGALQPSVYWSSLALAAAGWDLILASWPDDGRPEDFVVAITREGLTRLDASVHPLVVGKSIGSLAAPIVTAASVPAVWLTPLMDRDVVAAAVLQSPAPTLVIGGGSDPSWRRPSERDGLEVVELAGANHGLMIEGDWRASLTSIRDAVERVERFAAGLPR